MTPRRRCHALFVWLLALACAGCAAPSVPATATAVPSLAPPATSVVAASSTPPPVTAAPHDIGIPTGDGATLAAVQYGSAATAVIFSPMGDCVGDGAALAEAVAAHGWLALTYQWRACEPGGADAALLRRFVDDLRAVINFARAQGADNVVLVGASLGGVASAKLLVESGAEALVVMAAPAEVPSLDLTVSAADVASAVPKLFVTAEADTVVAPSASRALFDLAAEPKQWQTYPGSAHGTHLFSTGSGEAARQAILDFILSR
jgi:uncharacterized protein